MFKSRSVGLVTVLVLSSSALGGSAFDVNGDGSVSLLDYQQLADCLSNGGPGQSSAVECALLHADEDGDIDLFDTAGFLNAFTGSGIGNDSCVSPLAATNDSRPFSSVGASTDGAADPLCDHFNQDQVDRDIWFCYAATCTGTAVVSLCGSGYDTRLAVYAGCECPSASPIACSDDDCGFGDGSVQSRLEVSVVEGLAYLVRVGGYDNAEGEGLLSIGCNVAPCTTAVQDCSTPSPTEEPGCAESECCAATCDVDRFCCDVTWDAQCAGEAEGICNGNFAVCQGAAGACNSGHPNRGCDDAFCCNTVCFGDPFCCLTEWDETCADEADLACFPTCGDGTLGGGCFEENLTPGCSDSNCCYIVCSDDRFCCDTVWDTFCTLIAEELCP